MPTEWTISTLRQHIKALDKANRRALKLQAKELKRRLKILNGEHQTLATMSTTYLPREVYTHDMERAQGERDAAIRAAELARQAVEQQAMTNRRGVFLAVGIALVGWLISGAFLYLAWKHP